jgi:hypothetical protein
MTRKTPSRTKRELDKLRRRRNGDGDDGPREVAVAVAGVPAHDPAEADDPPTEEDIDVFEWCTVDLSTGEVERPERADDDLAGCSTDGCPNPVCPRLDTCEKCAGMPERDWRPVIREYDEEDA